MEPAARTVRVLVVDDNDVFRDALELLLGLTPAIDVVGTAADGGDVVEACRRLGPDVVLLDYRLPGLDGVQATAALAEACPEVSVVCLTASVSASERRALLEAGAADCLSKDGDLDAIVAALVAAADGRRPPA